MSDALEVPSHLVGRRQATGEAVERLLGSFEPHELTEERLPQVALYATGSLGRGEVGSRSDLDVFLIDAPQPGEPSLRNIDSIEFLADLIRAARAAEFGEFSGDGRFLKVHPLSALLEFLGTRQDDSTNVFTARMLLLLESEPLLGQDAFERCVDAVVDIYSRDAKGDETFRPAFLANDIVRYWKTLCLNYEAKRHEYHAARNALSKNGGDQEREGKVERLRVSLRVDLLKLRFNRLWTCFNGLAFLLAGADDRQVSKDHIRQMVSLKPVERAIELSELLPETTAPLQVALDEYAAFLERTDRAKAEVEADVADQTAYEEMQNSAEEFAGAMDSVIHLVGDHSGLGRFLLL